jgi:renalase
MIGCHQPPELAFDAARLDHPVLSWAAVNSAKPGRAAPFSLVVHSRNDWAEQHLEDDRDSVKRAMLTALTNLTGHDFAGADWIDLHRWRYANVEQALGQPFLFDPENGLAACGDWCLGNRVEAAFESAHSLGEVLADLILPE